ncbi:MAG TPA: hypothetical protein VNV88_15015 [Candidatus Solibacter sp.]|nr:hypothetical protein [Candidatus Solibacter sp.]
MTLVVPKELKNTGLLAPAPSPGKVFWTGKGMMRTKHKLTRSAAGSVFGVKVLANCYLLIAKRWFPISGLSGNQW